MITAFRRHPFISATLMAPLVVALALAGLFALWLHGVRLPYASGARWFELTKTASADYTSSPDKPVFILALGNDGRPGDTSTRGDAIHVIGVNPVQRKATILDFPRDTGLPIPGHGARQGQRRRTSTAEPGSRPRRSATRSGCRSRTRSTRTSPASSPWSTTWAASTSTCPRRCTTPTPAPTSRPGSNHLDGHQALVVRAQPPPVPDRRPQALREPGYLIISALGPAAGEEHRTDRHARTCSPTSAATRSSTASASATSTTSGGSACRSTRATCATSSSRSRPGAAPA